MSRRINTATKSKPYRNATRVNYEGHPAFDASDRELYLQMLLTNTLGNTFYASGDELADKSFDLHARVTQADPAFATKAIVFARSKGFMRLQPILGLVFLSVNAPSYFKIIFSDVIKTPGDLQDFVELVRGTEVRSGMGRAVKGAVNRWLLGMSEYHAIKYHQGGKGYSLSNILQLTHPKPITIQQHYIFKWLTDPAEWRKIETPFPTDKGRQIHFFESLKTATDTNDIIRCIDMGNLPYEVVTGAIKPTTEVWEHLMRQMPYFALLRHLVTLYRAGVFQKPENIEYVVERLTNQIDQLKAMIMPFRFMAAYNQVRHDFNFPSTITLALEEALNNSFHSVPELPGKIMLSPDVSGSMSMDISGDLTAAQIAGLLTGALWKKNPGAIVWPFDDDVRLVRTNARDSLMTIANDIGSLVGGGTQLAAPLVKALQERQHVDIFIGITDNMEWDTDGGKYGFLPVFRQYRAVMNPNVQAFLITVAPYDTRPTPQGEPGVHYIYGWNDSVLNYLGLQVATKSKVDLLNEWTVTE